MNGLGVVNLELKNICLLGKWHWRFALHKDSFWRKLIISKYGMNAKVWCLEDFSGSHVSTTWKHIVTFVFFPGVIVLLEKSNFNWKLGSGNVISFWDDCWCSSKPLEYAFPRLFSISLLKDNVVSDFFIDNCWSIPWRRRLFEWEQNEWRAMLHILVSHSPISHEDDQLSWKGSRNDLYSCFEVYALFFKEHLQSRIGVWDLIWHLKIPPKVQIFLWLLCHEKLSCNDFLIRRNTIIPSTLCYQCKNEEEECVHMFIKCQFSATIWSRFIGWWNCPHPQVSSCFSLLLWALHLFPVGVHKNAWLVSLATFLHSFWLFRNKVIFENGNWDELEIFQTIQRSSFSWLAAKLFLGDVSFSVWIDNPASVLP
ncbi:hypothetical protein REPUB_Repub10bG0040000 [Reevesia pubescens]